MLWSNFALTEDNCEFANCGLTIENCGFAICGLAPLRNLRICESGMSPRIRGITICKLKKKFVCPPLFFYFTFYNCSLTKYPIFLLQIFRFPASSLKLTLFCFIVKTILHIGNMRNCCKGRQEEVEEALPKNGLVAKRGVHRSGSEVAPSKKWIFVLAYFEIKPCSAFQVNSTNLFSIFLVLATPSFCRSFSDFLKRGFPSKFKFCPPSFLYHFC